MPGLSIASSASPVAAQAVAGNPAASGVGGALFAALLKVGAIGQSNGEAAALVETSGQEPQSAHPLALLNGRPVPQWITPEGEAATTSLLPESSLIAPQSEETTSETQTDGEAADPTAVQQGDLTSLVAVTNDDGANAAVSVKELVPTAPQDGVPLVEGDGTANKGEDADQLIETLQRGANVSAAAHGASHDQPGAVAAAVLALTPAASHTAVLNGAPGALRSAEVKLAGSDAATAVAATPEDAALPDGAVASAKSFAATNGKTDGGSGNAGGTSHQGRGAQVSFGTGGSETQSAPPTSQSAPGAGRDAADRFADFLQPAGRDAIHPAAVAGRSMDGLVFDMTGGARSASASNVIVAPATHLAAAIGLKIARAVDAGDSRFTIQIDPPELGRVEVRLDFSADLRVKAHLVADSRDTLHLLQRDSHALERALQDSGLKADSGSLSFTLRDDGGQPGKHVAFGQQAADSEDLSLISLSEETVDAPAPVVRTTRLLDLSV